MRSRTLFLSLAILCAAPAFAEEGRVPIFEPLSLSGSGVAGKYIVTRDIGTVDPGTVIEFVGSGTEHVEVDLNGFTIANTVAGSGAVIVANNLGKFTIRNGSIIASPSRGGLLVTNTVQAVVEDLSVKNTSTGVFVENPQQFAVRRVLADTAGFFGILVDGASGVDNTGIVQDCQVRRTGHEGIRVVEAIDGVTIVGNRVRDAGLAAETRGLYVDTTGGSDADDIVELRRNNVRNIDGWGIRVNTKGACTIEGNRVGGATRSGIWVRTNGCLIEDNVARLNDEAGIHVSGGRNQIRGNVVTDNGLGLWIAPSSCGSTGYCGNDNTFTKNTSRGNTGLPTPCLPPIGACAAPDLCLDPTTVGNTSFGDNLMPGGC
ncbi:MAG: right-handed parallel beta-helix repeat-containing protein [bacterium]|nr:right-handed parallel beta-helix repeat-containing protein [bacterium]